MGREDLGAAVVALVRNRMQVVPAKRGLCRLGHRPQLVAVEALVGDLVRDDQVGLGVDRALNIVADQATPAGAGRHGAGIRIGQGNLAVRGIGQGCIHRLEPRDFLSDAPVAPGEIGHLRGAGLTGLLAVDPHHLVDVAGHVGFQVRQMAGDLVLGEVAVAAVDRLELAAVDGDAGPLQSTDPAAELDEPRAGPADGGTVVTPEVGDGLVIRHQPPGQPHQFDVSSGLAFQSAAGGDAVQVAVDEELEKNRGMIPGPSCPRGRMSGESKPGQIKFVDKDVHNSNQVILADPVLQPLRKERCLLPVDPFDETRHACPRLPRRKANMPRSFHTASAVSGHPEQAVRMSGEGRKRRAGTDEIGYLSLQLTANRLHVPPVAGD